MGEFDNDSQHSEFSETNEVSISEYRTNQIVRLAEIGFASTVVFIAIKHRKELPTWVSTFLMIGGTAVALWIGNDFVMNWKRDGKLIRESIKQKKIEESKIRKKLIKGSVEPQPKRGVREKSKATNGVAVVKKEEAKAEPTNDKADNQPKSEAKGEPEKKSESAQEIPPNE